MRRDESTATQLYPSPFVSTRYRPGPGPTQRPDWPNGLFTYNSLSDAAMSQAIRINHLQGGGRLAWPLSSGAPGSWRGAAIGPTLAGREPSGPGGGARPGRSMRSHPRSRLRGRQGPYRGAQGSHRAQERSVGMQTYQVTCRVCGEDRWPHLVERPDEYTCVRCRSEPPGTRQARVDAAQRASRTRKSRPRTPGDSERAS